jgi:hypothetical protein
LIPTAVPTESPSSYPSVVGGLHCRSIYCRLRRGLI